MENCRFENGKSLKYPSANNRAHLDAFCPANDPEEYFHYVQ